MPSMISTVVVLPAPLGPSSPKHTPSGTLNETPATAVVDGYCFTSSRTSMIGVLIGRNARAVTVVPWVFLAVRDLGRQCTISPHEHRAVRQVRAQRDAVRHRAPGVGAVDAPDAA